MREHGFDSLLALGGRGFHTSNRQAKPSSKAAPYSPAPSPHRESKLTPDAHTGYEGAKRKETRARLSEENTRAQTSLPKVEVYLPLASEMTVNWSFGEYRILPALGHSA